MAYRPIFKRPEDEISKKVEEKVRIGIDNKIKKEVDEKVKANVEGVRAEVDEKVKTKIEERFKEEGEKVNDNIKIEVEARVLAILKEKEDKDKSDKANKIAKAVDVAKALKGESDSDKEKAEKEKIAIDKEKAVVAEKDLTCPTCHTEGRSGHIHRVETDNSKLVWKCNDKGCGYEAVLVPKNSDYKCKNCSMPIKKPTKEELVKDMSCPFCHNNSAIKFDWSKIWSVLKK